MLSFTREEGWRVSKLESRSDLVACLIPRRRSAVGGPAPSTLGRHVSWFKTLVAERTLRAPSLNAITLLKGERELRRRARAESGILEREWASKGLLAFSPTDLVR